MNTSTDCLIEKNHSRIVSKEPTLGSPSPKKSYSIYGINQVITDFSDQIGFNRGSSLRVTILTNSPCRENN